MIKKILIGLVAAVVIAGGVIGVVSARNAARVANSETPADVEVNLAQESDEDPLLTQAEVQTQTRQRLQIHDPENPGTEIATQTQTQTQTRLRELQDECDGTCECDCQQLQQNLGSGNHGEQNNQQNGTCEGIGAPDGNGAGMQQGSQGNGHP